MQMCLFVCVAVCICVCEYEAVYTRIRLDTATHLHVCLYVYIDGLMKLMADFMSAEAEPVNLESYSAIGQTIIFLSSPIMTTQIMSSGR